MSSKTQCDQFERFQKYMDAPCTELHEKDAGRGDAHRLAFQEWGVPEEFLLWLWQAAEAAALELAAQEVESLKSRIGDPIISGKEVWEAANNVLTNSARAIRALAAPVEREGDKS